MVACIYRLSLNDWTAFIGGGLFVFILEMIFRYFIERRRKKNILSSVKAEMQFNEEFAKHNKGCVERIQNGSSKTYNLINYENTASRKILQDEYIKTKEELSDSIMHFVVVVEHVNSIITEFKESHNNASELIDYSTGLNQDSISKNSKEILQLLTNEKSCFI